MRYRPAGEADAYRLLSLDEVTSQDELHRSAAAHSSRQALGAAHAWNHSQRDLRL
jgi:hypothetical protein